MFLKALITCFAYIATFNVGAFRMLSRKRASSSQSDIVDYKHQGSTSPGDDSTSFKELSFAMTELSSNSIRSNRAQLVNNASDESSRRNSSQLLVHASPKDTVVPLVRGHLLEKARQFDLEVLEAHKRDEDDQRVLRYRSGLLKAGNADWRPRSLEQILVTVWNVIDMKKAQEDVDRKREPWWWRLGKAYLDTNAVLSDLYEDEETLTDAIAMMGFDYEREELACKELIKADLEVAAKLFEEEFDQCDAGDVGKDSCDVAKCKEKADSMCPEGTACDCEQSIKPLRFGMVYSAVFGTDQIIKGTIGAVLGGFGFMGSPVTGALTVMAIPTGSAVYAGAAASYMAAVQKCHCAMQPCEWIEGGYCGITGVVSNTSRTPPSNKYARLPFRGFKCIPEHRSDECIYQPCSEDDLKAGKVGIRERGTYSCVWGTLADATGRPPSLPERMEMYDNLKVDVGH